MDSGSALKCVRTWSGFKRQLGNRVLVSHKAVMDPLRKLCQPLTEGIKTITLVDVLRWEMPSRQVDAETAKRLGKVICKTLLDCCDDDERCRLREVLSQMQFLNRKGDPIESSQLLIGHQPGAAVHDGRHDERHDERMRAAFAPRDRVLAVDYDFAGLDFFEVCRGGHRTTPEKTAEEMAGWVSNATDEATRRAALEYLAEGEEGRAVQRELDRNHTAGTWLEELAKRKEFQSMKPAQQGHLLSLIPEPQGRDFIAQACTTAAPVTRIIKSSSDATEALKKISKWWDGKYKPKIQVYEQRTFPDSGLRHLNRTSNPNDELSRKDWMTLFMIGLTFTMGRTKAEQHRGFISLCESQGWLDIFCRSRSEPDEWTGILDDYWRDKIDESCYLQWMKQFVCFWPISRHLDGYIAAFESVEFMPRPFDLTQIPNPKSNSEYSGGGPDAPPLSRALGMGQYFVLRELVRRGVITNRHAHRHCYVPSKRVRDLFTFLGCEGLDQPSRKWELSQHIHKFLAGHLGDEAATFQHCFDIPFQIIAEDKSLQGNFDLLTIDFKDDEDDS